MNRYVEAMARAAYETDIDKRKYDNVQDRIRDLYRRDARCHLAALIAELRADPGAVEAIHPCNSLGQQNGLALEALAALCDYLAGDG